MKIMFDTPQELLDQIALGEDSVLEFKSIHFEHGKIVGLDSRAMADEMAAFANGIGGVIVLGVDDRTHEIVGIPLETLDVVETWVRAFLNDSITPPLEAYIRRIWLPGSDGMKRPCIRIDVPEGMTVYRSPNGYYHRIGSSKRVLTPEELMRLFQRRGRVALAHYDEQTLPDLTLETLQRKLFQRFRPTGVTMEDAELLQKLKMMAPDKDGVLRPTVTGVLFATEEPQELVPNAYVQCVCYAGTDRDAADQVDAHDITGPLDRQIRDTCAFVRRNMRIRAHKFEGRIDYPQYDMTAVFEAVVNAVAHRDYSMRGAKVRLHMFADRMEIISPGCLPGNLRIEEMPYWQETRNEAICALLARCPMLVGFEGTTRKFLMDARGEGVPIILARSERISGRKAEYHDIRGSGLMLTIPGALFSDELPTSSSEHAADSSEKTADSSEKAVDSSETASDSSEKPVDSSETATDSSEKASIGSRVLLLIAKDAAVTQSSVARDLHCPRSTVAYWFKKLAKDGAIYREGPDKGGRWIVNDSSRVDANGGGERFASAPKGRVTRDA